MESKVIDTDGIMSRRNKKVFDELSIGEMVAGKCNGDLFISVRQRVAAYRMYRGYHKLGQYKRVPEYDYLDGAYRFINQSAEPKFLVYCAKRESYSNPIEYVRMLLES